MTDFRTVGLAGVGNMGGALLGGIKEATENDFDVIIYDKQEDFMRDRAEKFGVRKANSVNDLVNSTDFIILCVKPSDVEDAINNVDDVPVNVISIAAGVSITQLRSCLNESSSIIRVMPNTPAQIGEGMSFLARGQNVSEDFLQTARTVLETVGSTAVIDEKDMDAVTALSGSGPAYVFYFIEALREAGVYLGLEDEESLLASLQTLYGASKLARESDRDPEELRQAVSSPGGTTVEALQVLDEYGVKGKIKEAVIAAFEKSRTMGEDN